MKNLLLILLSLPLFIKAQQKDSSIQVLDSAGGMTFSAALPALKPIPGAPAPFYTYFWDFGDGHFSTAQNPQHNYDTAGTFTCNFYAVNNYDDGRKPGKKQKKIVVQKVNKGNIAALGPEENNFFKANGIFELKYNCMAKPSDSMLLTAGWKNTSDVPQKGRLYLFINEKLYKANCFDTAGTRVFHNEERVITLDDATTLASINNMQLTQSGSPASNIKETFAATKSQQLVSSTFKAYKIAQAFNVQNMQAGEQRFMFTELRVTPEMIKDTNTTLVITGLYIPESGNAVMHKLNIPVVTSHDPNKMNLRHGRLSYRFLKKNKALDYKVRFQNNGKGPASTVALAITLPANFKNESFVLKDLYPFCPSCDSVADKKGCWQVIKTKDSLLFTFHNIYLPGTHQQYITDKDSTKGFIAFTVATKKRLQNQPFKGRTAIYFDNNEPVITNNATGRFKKGLSPIIMAGYQQQFNKGLDKGLQIGVGLAPLAPHKPYFQFEVFFQTSAGTTSSGKFLRQGTIAIDTLKYDYLSVKRDSTFTLQHIKIVPLHFRYNLNKFISVGIGVMADMKVKNQTTIDNTFFLGRYNGVQNYPYTQSKNKNAGFSTSFQPFAEIQLGKVRLGPLAGFRYYYGENNNNYGYFYAAWRL